MTKTMKTILCVDDHPGALSLLKSVFQKCGFAVFTAGDPLEAIASAEQTTFDLAVLDYELPNMSGISLAKSLRRIKPLVPLVLFSGCLSITDEELSAVDAYVAKGENINILLAKVRDLLHLSQRR
jgi:DNA-binding response OmpR family regulator